MSCNSCSNVTLPPGIQGPPGPQGPAGPAGADGINGTSGIDGINGTNGTDGVALLKSIGAESADYTSSSYGPPSISLGDAFPWVVPGGTLSADFDTLRLEGLALFTKGEAEKKLRIMADGIPVKVGFTYTYPFVGADSFVGCRFVVDFVRTSSTTLRVESDSYMLFTPSGYYLYDYTTAQFSFSGALTALMNNQIITVGSDMGSFDFNIDLDISTENPSEPLKLVNCKLLKFKKV